MTYDLIIVSQSRGELIQITQNCIDSARQDNAELNIIIVETGNPFKYDVDKIIQYNGAFNYNRALNLGLKYAKSDFQILANNDIIFEKGWSRIGELMQAGGYLSASALSNDGRHASFKPEDVAYEGYTVGYQLAGWCIFTYKKLWDIIGKIDERFPFWFADNAYAKQIKEKGIKHALIGSVRVNHLGSSTLAKQDKQTQRRFTRTFGEREFRNL